MTVEKAKCIYKAYKNTVMPHERHIYAKTYDIAKARMCANSHADHTLPNWKCVLQFFPNVPALLFLTSKQIISIPTPVLQFVFTFII